MFAINTDNKKKTRMLYIFKKTLSLSFSYSKCLHEYEKVFKKGESIEILKIIGLISNMEY